MRAFSSAGSEHLPYKQRVGGSNPSTPTTENQGVTENVAPFFIALNSIGWSHSLTENLYRELNRELFIQALPSYHQRRAQKLLITDSQINNVCRDYYNNLNFGTKDSTISMFDFHNLLTESNKSSYIDSYVQRAINATDVAVGIANALRGDSEYSWFLG